MRIRWNARQQKPGLYVLVDRGHIRVGSVSVCSKAIKGKKAVETFFFDDEGKVYKALATYDYMRSTRIGFQVSKIGGPSRNYMCPWIADFQAQEVGNPGI